jgi:predicted xylose isomerase-like sugar epimerase
MVSSLGALATVLGIDATSMVEAANDVTLACGVDDIADATDVAQVRALAKVAALRVAQTTAAGMYDFEADGGSYKRSQVMAQIASMLSAAESAAMQYDANYSVEVGTVTYTADPYDWDLEDDTEAEGVA